MSSSPHKARLLLYENPRLYDLAFSFRDLKRECDGLLALGREHGLENPKSVVELACGPAHHLRELARRGLKAFGVDVSPEMLEYARSLCERDHVSVGFQRSDMRTFELPKKVDLALCLFDSFTYCTSDADGIAAMRATAGALKRSGLLILELTHPADYFGLKKRRTLNRWTERHTDVDVRARYDVGGHDSVAETYVATMTIDARYRDGRAPRRIVSRQLHRMWFRSAVLNVAGKSGMFEVVGWYGDLSRRVPLSMKLEAWRMVAVLRRRA